MTPDFKRLCEAAQFAYEGEEETSIILYDAQAEAIVRAVLMVLREPSKEMQHAADVVEVDYGAYRAPIGYEAAEAFTAMIDHVLDTKARRAKALQDLADIDRDLL